MTIRIFIPFVGVGKGRPRTAIKQDKEGRVIRRTTYTDPRYKAWKNTAIAHLVKLKMEGLPNLPKPCEVKCYFCNFFSSDSDNLIGAVMDAMHQAGLIGGDSSSYVVGCSGKFYKVKKPRNKPRIRGILIEVVPAQIEWLDEDLANLIYRNIPDEKKTTSQQSSAIAQKLPVKAKTKKS